MSEASIAECPACGSPDLFPYRDVRDLRVTQEIFHLLRCPQCGLVITTPQPPESEIGRYYETEDYISHAAEARSLMDKVYYRVRLYMAGRKLRLIRKYTIGKRLIDIGAGTGFFGAFLQQKGWLVRAFEPGESARDVAREQHGIEVEDIPELFNQEPGSADAITMWHVLEHVHNPNQYLTTIHGLLAPGGRLFLALPNYMSTDCSYYKTDWAAWDVPRHLWHFHAYALERMLACNGFVIEAKYGMPFDTFYVSLVSEKYRGGGLVRAVRALCIASLSNLIAFTRVKKSSSIIYVVSKSGATQ